MAFGQLRTGMGLARRRAGGGAAGPLAAPFTSVLGPSDGAVAGALNGWAARYAAQPTITTPVPFDVDDDGYDATGTATTIRRRLYVTTAVMEPWNNASTQSALDAAMSEYVFADTTFPAGGVSNTSTAAYPKVIAGWVNPPKQLLGAGLWLEVLAFHQLGRSSLPVRAVKITGTPTTGSPVTKTCTYEKSSLYGDNLPCWRASFADSDFPSNGNADVTFTFEAFPWVGGSAAIRDTTGGTFPLATVLTPQVHRTVGGTVRYAYVDNVSGGAGTTSTDPVAAAASPYLTINGALDGAFAAASNGSFTFIRVKNSGSVYTWDGTAPAGTRNAPDHWFTIEGDPADANPRANITIQTSTTTYKQVFNNGAGTQSYLRLRNIGLTIAVGAQGFFGATAAGRALMWLDNVRFLSNMAASTTWVSNLLGCFFTNSDGQGSTTSARAFNSSSTNRRVWLVRGCTTNQPIGGNVLCSTTVDASAISGEFMTMGDATNLQATNVIAHNIKATGWLGNTSSAWSVPTTGGVVRDIAIVQCEVVCSNSATNPVLPFGENVALDYDNIYLDYITVRGGTDAESGRINIHNDPTTIPTTAVSDQCVYTNFAYLRNLGKYIAIKDDVFHGDNEADTGAGFLVMGWVKRYGVMFGFNTSNISPDNFAPNYFGYESTRQSGVTFNGSGQPTANAPAIPSATWQALTWDIDGVARRTDGTGVSGCRES